MSLAGMILAGDSHVLGSSDDTVTSCAEARLSPGWHSIRLTYLSPPGAHHSYLRMSMHEPQSVDERYPGRYVIQYNEPGACARGRKASSGNDCSAPLSPELFRTRASADIVGDAAPSAAPSARKLSTRSLNSEQSGNNAAVLHDRGAVRRLTAHSTSSGDSAASSNRAAADGDATGSDVSVSTTAANSGGSERSRQARGGDGRARDEREPRETDREPSASATRACQLAA